MTLDRIGSNKDLGGDLVFKLVDYDGQTMILENTRQILIQPTNHSASSMGGFNSGIFKQGVVALSSVKFVATPGSQNVTFVASTKAIDQAKIKKIFGGVLSNNTISVDFRY